MHGARVRPNYKLPLSKLRSVFFILKKSVPFPNGMLMNVLSHKRCGWCAFTLRSVLARLGVDRGHPDAPTPPPPQSICPETTFETVCLRHPWALLSNGFTPEAWSISQQLAFPHLQFITMISTSYVLTRKTLKGLKLNDNL